MNTKTIKQTVIFKATPSEVYGLIMESKKHASFTGQPASISKKQNGKFTVYGGYCHGHNLELKEGKKIVQAWHFAQAGWPEDHFSICIFVFEASPKGTKLRFTQSEIPEYKVESLKEGWKEFYWQPMKQYLMKKEK